MQEETINSVTAQKLEKSVSLDNVCVAGTCDTVIDLIEADRSEVYVCMHEIMDFNEAVVVAEINEEAAKLKFKDIW